jgi:hypothetical protein
MVRLLGMFGFTGGFLVISPEMRQTVWKGLHLADTFLQAHSPYSYLGVVLLVFGGVTMTLVTGQKPH